MNPSRGWRARLRLEFDRRGSRTEITARSHEGPLLVQRVFHPESGQPAASGLGEPCHAYVIHPPGGAASGDDLRLDVALRPGAHALLTTPAAGKYYRRGPGGVARMVQEFQVDGAALEWLPQENIFYPDAAAELSCVVTLSGAARFMGWEIACFGLPASGLSLQSGDLRLGFEVWQGSAPLLLERLTIDDAALGSRWGMAGHAALGCAMAYPCTAPQLELARAVAASNCADMMIACTLVDGVLVCRVIAQRADRLKASFIRLWQALRPGVVGREALPPRIWAT